jgi:hypothetical protein
MSKTNLTDIKGFTMSGNVRQASSSDIQKKMSQLCQTEIHWFSMPESTSPVIVYENSKIQFLENFSVGDLLENQLECEINEGSLVCFLPRSYYSMEIDEVSRIMGILMTEAIILNTKTKFRPEDEISLVMGFCRVVINSNCERSYHFSIANFMKGMGESLAEEYCGYESLSEDLNSYWTNFDFLNNPPTNRYLKKIDPYYDPYFKIELAHMAHVTTPIHELRKISDDLPSVFENQTEEKILNCSCNPKS